LRYYFDDLTFDLLPLFSMGAGFYSALICPIQSDPRSEVELTVNERGALANFNLFQCKH